MKSENSVVADYLYYLEGGGRMGELTRSFDWTQTSIGGFERWPQSLLTTVNMLLGSRFPMFLWWGTDLVQFYNDAYRPSLGAEGKHPKALGQQGRECWPEIWPVIKPLIDQVMAGGPATWSEDQLIPIYRNNRLEDVYWTFSYSQVKNGREMPGGVLVTCFETTEKVRAARETSCTLNALVKSESKLRYMLAGAPVAIAVFAGREMIIESANNKILEVWDKTSEIIGKPLHMALPELEGQAFLQLLDDVFTSGEPFYGNEIKALVNIKGRLTDIYFNFVYQPLKNAADETFAVMVVATDITEQVNARKRLEIAEDILRLAIEASDIGTWTADLTTDELIFSERARLIQGIPENFKLTLNESTRMIREEFRERVSTNIKQAIRTGNSFHEEYWIDPIDGGNPKWIRSNGKAYYNEQKKPVYITGTLLDLTEQRQDEMRKNDFLGMVSHELKTPLTSLTALVQMLGANAKKNDDLFSQDALQRANKQVKKMNTLINGFLNISSLESGKIQLIKKQFNLDDLISDVFEDFSLVTKTHTILFEPCGAAPVLADFEKIVSVVTNLLTNAVKYSPNGRNVEIKCKILKNKALVSVKDEGMGVKAKDKERLFERYYRVINKENQGISGFGLGLYLSAEIIKRHDGEIWVESEAGEGSTFFFTLPLNVQ